jgi:hypothetical protein
MFPQLRQLPAPSARSLSTRPRLPSLSPAAVPFPRLPFPPAYSCALAPPSTQLDRTRHFSPLPKSRSALMPSLCAQCASAVGLQLHARKIHFHQTKPFSTPRRTQDNHLHTKKQTDFRIRVSRLNTAPPDPILTRRSQIIPYPMPQKGLTPPVPQSPPPILLSRRAPRGATMPRTLARDRSRPNDWDPQRFPIQRLGPTPWDIA